MEEENKTGRSNLFGVAGCILGFLALAAAFLSPWIAEAIDPPSPTLEEDVADFADRLKGAFEAKRQGQDHVADTRERLPSWYLAPGIIGLGLVASGFGLGSFLKKEETRFSGAAFALGLSTVLVQWSIIIVGIIIFLVLVAVVMAALGVDPAV